MINRLCAILIAFGAAAAVAGPELGQAQMDKYHKSCSVCHDSGAAGAAKTGDTAAWQPLLDKGMQALVESVNKGLNAMPPRGMCFDCSDADYRALIEYMASPAG